MSLLSFPRFWTVLIFILIYFEWRETENQQYSNQMDTVFNKKGYIKTPEETSNKVMHDNIPDKNRLFMI